MTSGVGKRLSKLEREDVVRWYKGGDSSELIAKRIGVSGPAIRKTLERAGVVRRDARVCHRTFTCAPSVITHETPEGAYWLGFFAADGYISRDGRVEISLAKKDLCQVEAFKDFLCSNHPIREKTNCFHFGIRHPELVAAFSRYEIGNCKSLTLKASSLLEKNPHFWRGLLDGDGWIGTPKNCPRIQLIGAEEITKQFKTFCSNIIPGPDFYRKPHVKGRVWNVRIHGDNARCLAKHIYGIDGPALERKQSVARSWFQ